MLNNPARLKMPLDVPGGFLCLSDSEKSEICNGAGAKGGIKVPNTMWGLDCRYAFDVHDYDYWAGETLKDKREGDKRMLFNLVTIILNNGGILAGPRLYRAMTYFAAVAFFGRKAFYAGKCNNGNYESAASGAS